MCMKLGMTLPNGATVIAFDEDPYGTSGVVLALRPSSASNYAVWSYQRGKPESTYQGDYCTSIHEAVERFDQRRKEEL